MVRNGSDTFGTPPKPFCCLKVLIYNVIFQPSIRHSAHHVFVETSALVVVSFFLAQFRQLYVIYFIISKNLSCLIVWRCKDRYFFWNCQIFYVKKLETSTFFCINASRTISIWSWANVIPKLVTSWPISCLWRMFLAERNVSIISSLVYILQIFFFKICLYVVAWLLIHVLMIFLAEMLSVWITPLLVVILILVILLAAHNRLFKVKCLNLYLLDAICHW